MRHPLAVCILVAPLALLAGCAGGLSGLVPGLDPRIDQASLSAESKSALAAYWNKPTPKAFVVSPETGKNWHAWGAGTVEEAEAISMSKCEELTGTRCVPFARNNEIVWTPPASASAPTGTPAEGSGGAVTTTTVNLRNGPGTDHAVVVSVPAGTAIEPMGIEGSWRLVRLADGWVGYIHADYIGRADAIGNEVGAVPPTPKQDRLERSELRALERAAEGGDAQSQYDLGNRYMHGFGVERDVVEARRWMERAAENGHAVAAYEMGLIYERGQGVEVDRNEALRWYDKAAAAGHGPSRDRATQLRRS